MKLLGNRLISGKIKCLSGLRIGAASDIIEIGGLDNPIIKNPVTGLPYVPGSSIKGKMRSLLELTYDKVDENGGPCKCGKSDCFVCRLFGVSGSEEAVGSGVSRLIFRDALLTDEWEVKLSGLRRRGLEAAEIKYENVINRRKGTAEHPRPMERVPAGTEFIFNISYRVFEGDKESEDRKKLAEGLLLIEKDALGGCGSRGYGQIKFEELTWDGKPFDPSKT